MAPLNPCAKALRRSTEPKRDGRPLTDAELDAGMTVEQMQQHQRELKAAAAKRREKAA